MQRVPEQVAAGYVILWFADAFYTRESVNGFTPISIGEFCLSHPNMQTPKWVINLFLNEEIICHFPDWRKKNIKVLPGRKIKNSRPYFSLTWFGCG